MLQILLKDPSSLRGTVLLTTHLAMVVWASAKSDLWGLMPYIYMHACLLACWCGSIVDSMLCDLQDSITRAYPLLVGLGLCLWAGS